MRRAFPRDFVRDGAIVFASWTLLSLLGYAVHFTLSRRLGLSEYGAFASLIAATAILGIPAAIVMMVVVKFVAEFHALEEPGKIRAISLRVFTPCAVLAVATVVLGTLLRAQIAGYFHLSHASDAVAASTAVAVGLLLPPVRGVLQGTQDFAAFAISIAIDAVARFALAVALVYAGFGVAGAFWGYAAAGAFSLGYTVFAARKHWAPVPEGLTIDVRRLLVTMGGAAAATAAITFMGYADLALVKHLFAPEDAGTYGAASFCGKILFFIVGFVPLLILPKAAQHAARGSSSRLILAQGVALTALLAGAGLAVFFLAPRAVVTITYGSAFVSAAPYVFKYGAAMSVLGITNVVVNYGVGLHRFNFLLPLLAMAICEPLAISVLHSSLGQVIDVLLAVNAAALGLCLVLVVTGRKLAPAVSADSETARGYTASA